MGRRMVRRCAHSDLSYGKGTLSCSWRISARDHDIDPIQDGGAGAHSWACRNQHATSARAPRDECAMAKPNQSTVASNRLHAAAPHAAIQPSDLASSFRFVYQGRPAPVPVGRRAEYGYRMGIDGAWGGASAAYKETVVAGRARWRSPGTRGPMRQVAFGRGLRVGVAGIICCALANCSSDTVLGKLDPRYGVS